MNQITQNFSLRRTVALNVLAHRTALGVSQEALAVKAGFHRTYISQIERELANLTLDNIERLADALDIDAKLLFVSQAHSVTEAQVVVDHPNIEDGHNLF